MRGRPQRKREKVLKRLFAVYKVSAIASFVNRSVSTVSAWHQVPAEHVLTIERNTGISRHILRPDVYGKEVK